MEHQQWEPQFVYLKDKSKAINIKHKVSPTNQPNPKPNNIALKDQKLEKKIQDGKLKHDAITPELRTNIQKGRSSKNLTQKQLANMCNLPVSVINEIESGKAKYNPVQINKIKRILKI